MERSLQDQNPYAAPQAILSNSAGLGPESDLQLSPEFFPAATGGKLCLLSILIILVSLVIAVVCEVLRQDLLAIIVIGFGLLIGVFFYYVGLNKLRQLPTETGARIAFMIAFVLYTFWIMIFGGMIFIAISNMEGFSLLFQLINQILQFVITVSTLYGQRQLGKYLGDTKLLSYNLYAGIGYGLLTMTVIALNGLLIARVINIRDFTRVPSDKALVLMMLFAFVVLTSLVVYVYGLASAFKRISDIAKERFMQRKTTSAIGLPDQNPDQNQFELLR
jgi:hypothetical protein